MNNDKNETSNKFTGREMNKQYSGPLKLEQIAKGVDLSLQNATDLLDEANILLRHDKIARAFALSALAEEEMGKVPLLARTIWFEPQDTEYWQKFWKRYRSHEAKYRDIVMLDLLFLPDKEPEEILKQLSPKAVEANRLKQLAFYVDFIPDAFTLPNRLFDKASVHRKIQALHSKLDVMKISQRMDTLEAFKRMKRDAEKMGMRAPKTLDDFKRMLENTRNGVRKALSADLLDMPIAKLDDIPECIVRSLGKQCTLLEALEMDLNVFATKTGLTLEEAFKVKRSIARIAMKKEDIKLKK